MKKLIGIMAVLVFVVGVCSAQVVVSKVEDSSVALRVYNGYTGTLTIAVASGGAGNYTVTCDGLANTVAGSTITSNADVSAAIVACTNTAGYRKLVVDAAPSLATDVLNAHILTATYTALPGKWLEILWDTSTCLHYDLYFGAGKHGFGAYTISRIVAYPGGTGNVTAAIYEDGVLIAEKVVTSPVYVFASILLTGGTNVNTNTLGVDAVVNIDWPLGIRSLGAKPIIVRVSRATTATTGVISAITE